MTEEKSLEEYVADWKEKKVKPGVPEIECQLPFMTNAPKMIECRVCYRSIYPGEEIRCIVAKCKSAFHRSCAESKFKLPKQKVVSDGEINKKRRKSKHKFLGPAVRCSLHECMICKKVKNWRCVKCTVAAHTKCAPWKEHILALQGGKQAVCWRHPSNWQLQNENSAVTNDIKEAFDRLPLPYFEEEFSMDTIIIRDVRYASKPVPEIKVKAEVKDEPLEYGNLDIPPGFNASDRGRFKPYWPSSQPSNKPTLKPHLKKRNKASVTEPPRRSIRLKEKRDASCK
ncbi:histone-lysine N-methyltransferase ASHR3-like [Carex rostrata]